MRKLVILLVIVIAALATVAFYSGLFSREPAQAAAGSDPPDSTPARGGRPGAGAGAFARPPMAVELALPTRADMAEQLTVVGNLIGEATVQVVPKAAGRLEEISVRMGDRVARGQRIARIEDREIREQVKQAEAAYEVSRAMIRQREADLKFAETNLDRSRNLFQRQLLPRQTLDDADARYQASVAQLDLARAQFAQAQARLEELRITLANTIIVSPVDGFVARRAADPGAYASVNQPIADVVDISRVRLVVNIVEKDLRRIGQGQPGGVEVDAFPGERFAGRISRVAPVLDPATRTAQIEIEIPNRDFRLKPGMYARVILTVEQRSNALVVPRNAVVDVEGQRGVFLARNDTAHFQPVKIGLEEPQRVEVVTGLSEQDRVVTTGAAALRDGDRILPNRRPGGPSAQPGNGQGGGMRGGGPGGRPTRQGSQRPGE